MCLGCMFAMFAATFPRAALVVIWLFTDWIKIVFGDQWLLPLLGVIFLPFTTLMWVLLYTPGIGITGADWLWLALSVVLDLYGGVTGGRYAWLNRSNVPGVSKTGAPV